MIAVGTALACGPAKTMAACQRANARVHAIGLRTKDLDSGELSGLANEAGGCYVEASSTNELSTPLAETSTRVRQHYCRLVVTAAPSHGPLRQNSVMEIRVGGKNGIDLFEPLGMPSVRNP